MEKIGLFYGSDTGCTEIVARMIAERLSEYDVTLVDVYDIEEGQMLSFDKLIFGLSTWHDGQLQSAWDDYYNTFAELDLSGKTVALFGLGDQYGYSTYFCDGIGVIGKLAEKNGAKIIGNWPTEGYEHDDSRALLNDETFIGLCLDEDNQDELTEERVDGWVEKIRKEFAEA